ncbi:MAG: LLM class flavin-dependent oxidoreductase [Saprospiraceae bacterium]
MSNIKIGILEFGFRDTQWSSMGTILDVIDYAVKADELGFSRFWLGEHHNFIATSSWSTPQVLLPILLQSTQHINVGMAGILINYYSPYEVACNFKMLANLFPDRCDLGYAAGTPPRNIGQELLQRSFSEPPMQYFENIARISQYFHQEIAVAEKEKIVIPPFRGDTPNLFLLSSSFKRAQQAIDLQLNIAKSIFHSPDSILSDTKESIQQYRTTYEDTYGRSPQIVLAFIGTCQRKASKAIALAEEFTLGASGFRYLHNGIVGTPDQFYDRIHYYAETLGIHEFVFLDSTLRNEDKIESLHLLSEKFELKSTIQPEVALDLY